jgi:hypothetical protein
MAGYLLWAFEQQFILQDYFLLRLLRILPTQFAAVIAAAVLFSTAHLPNPVLMAATLVWGIVSCTLFLRRRNLYALGLVHGILGLGVAISVPDAVTHHMMVGLGYLHYRLLKSPNPVHRNHKDQMTSTSVWVVAEDRSRWRSRHARP